MTWYQIISTLGCCGLAWVFISFVLTAEEDPDPAPEFLPYYGLKGFLKRKVVVLPRAVSEADVCRPGR